ncbi:MAG: lactate utilization protein [Spirochaetes bacterium]|nr:lactate utilization protein [Spirochaetota bacterium]
MNPVESWHAAALGEGVVKALKKNGFDAVFVADADAAAEKVMSFVRSGMTVGFGGSMTVSGLGVKERMKAAGAVLLDHNAPGISADQRRDILRRQLTCDLFVSGSNAVTLEGDIVNVDGNGNRVAALSYGPSKTVVVVGTNKVTADLDDAFARIELYASPMNNKRLEKTNPCVKSGVCQDCEGDTRICRIYQILRRRPSMSDFTVIVVGESLGF